MEEDIIIPTDTQREEFKRLGHLFSNPSQVTFVRIGEKTKIGGLNNGDVVIVERDIKPSEGDIRMYFDRCDGRYYFSRNDMGGRKYWGRVSWILVKP